MVWTDSSGKKLLPVTRKVSRAPKPSILGRKIRTLLGLRAPAQVICIDRARVNARRPAPAGFPDFRPAC